MLPPFPADRKVSVLARLRSFDLDAQATDVVCGEDKDPGSRNSSIMAMMELAASASPTSGGAAAW